uniref:Uncharacterized protein n=1 Tax=viral metagenome TaxID=1070528 RepID=A0A6M3J8S6_9ZZZZ
MTVTTYADLEDTIRARFVAQITAGGDGGAAIPTHVPNLGWFSDATTEIAQPDSGLRAEINLLHGEAYQAEVGVPSTTRRTGVLVVTLSVDADLGENELLDAVVRVVAAFRKQSVGGVTYRVPYPTGRRREGSAWRTNVNCPWMSDVVE